MAMRAIANALAESKTLFFILPLSPDEAYRLERVGHKTIILGRRIVSAHEYESPAARTSNHTQEVEKVVGRYIIEHEDILLPAFTGSLLGRGSLKILGYFADGNHHSFTIHWHRVVSGDPCTMIRQPRRNETSASTIDSHGGKASLLDSLPTKLASFACGCALACNANGMFFTSNTAGQRLHKLVVA